MDPSTEAIAETAATAAAAEVIAEQAQEDADEALALAEETAAESEIQWTITQQDYIACEARITALESQLAEMRSTPELAPSAGTGSEPEDESSSSTPPTLEMEVKEPEKKSRTGFRMSKSRGQIKLF
jgi:hypothetical protein